MADLTDKELCIDLAKDLMGWDFWDAMEPPPGFPMFADWDRDELALYEDADTGDVTRWWAPLERIEDAWEVLEKVSTLPFPAQWRFMAVLSELEPLPTKVHLSLRAASKVASLSWRLWRFLFCVDPRAAICHAAWEAIQVEGE